MSKREYFLVKYELLYTEKETAILYDDEYDFLYKTGNNTSVTKTWIDSKGLDFTNMIVNKKNWIYLGSLEDIDIIEIMLGDCPKTGD